MQELVGKASTRRLWRVASRRAISKEAARLCKKGTHRYRRFPDSDSGKLLDMVRP
jgi:hypothetical protein